MQKNTHYAKDIALNEQFGIAGKTYLLTGIDKENKMVEAVEVWKLFLGDEYLKARTFRFDQPVEKFFTI